MCFRMQKFITIFYIESTISIAKANSISICNVARGAENGNVLILS